MPLNRKEDFLDSQRYFLQSRKILELCVVEKIVIFKKDGRGSPNYSLDFLFVVLACVQLVSKSEFLNFLGSNLGVCTFFKKFDLELYPRCLNIKIRIFTQLI